MRLLYKPFGIIGGIIAARIGRKACESVWTKIDEASEKVAPAALRRWVRTSGPAGTPIEALTGRDFGAFEDQLAELEQRGFVVRRRDGNAPGG